MAGQWKLYLFTNMCHTTRSKIPIFELTSVSCSFPKQITGSASPDGIVHDSSNTADLLGLVEIKNPFSLKDKHLDEASFCLEMDTLLKMGCLDNSVLVLSRRRCLDTPV